MYSQVNIYRAPDKTLPEEFLDICSGNKSDVIGAAFADGTKVLTVNLDGLDLQTVKDTLKMDDYKSFGIFVCFGNEDNENDVPETSLQPFVTLRGSDNSELAVCFLEGESWVGIDTTNQSDTAECLLHKDYLAEKVSSMYSDLGDDLDKLIAKMKTPFIKREFESCIGKRGQIVFLFANKEYIVFSKNFEHSNFTWGWASQRFGYTVDLLNAQTAGQQDGAAIAPAATGPKNMFGAKPAAASTAAPTVAAATTALTVARPAAAVPSVSVPGTGPQPHVDTSVLFYPPENVLRGSNKERKSYIAQYVGFQPEDWKSAKPGPWPLKQSYLATAASLHSAGKIVLVNAPPKPATAAAPAKVAAPEPTEAPVILSTEDKKRVETIFSPIVLGTMDSISQYIDDPSRIEEMIRKNPSFLDQMGWPDKQMLEKGLPKSLDFFNNWRRASWEQLIRLKIDWAVQVIQEFQMERWKLQRALAEATKVGKAA